MRGIQVSLELSAEDQARIERTVEALEERGVHTLLVADRQAALAQVLELIPHGASVAHGTSTTLQEIGLVDYLCRPDSGYRYLNHEWTAENDGARRQRMRATLSAGSDYYLGSVQATVETGQVIGVDLTGSRQAFYVYGPPHVIWVAGVNKIVPTLDDAMRRVREIALPMEDQRMKRTSAQGSSIGKMVIYEHERPGRIMLVLVGEPLGF
jgi:L-lactate utilization protein LutB